ncbi:PLP-dependent aminotransferase family protein [Ktedonosporobacter rubrisoli]|uniref:PLP-dependent aminotransferase family protein n=1 Tax=Ktedonosporobacter rubrisoli TaxID=2509675 RepID=A0A4P6JIJ8_KTERU|nr:PLP-dependent aminotransferase family protein [Ktedonosporobacter rubrisoli]QBD74895.1 PLP-dependent aminotransferase family protein [Ktedonosporobacter rubrisoli]
MPGSLVARLHIALDGRDSLPLFRQLYAALRSAILAGQLEGGTRLPPTRRLAEELGVSRKTVVNAFEQLIAEGYLEGKIGSGTYVADVLPEDVLQVGRASKVIPTSSAQPELSKWGASLALREDRHFAGPRMRAFQLGIPALAEFPTDLWARLAAQAWRTARPELLTYGEAQGYWPLRQAIASYLKTVRGMNCEPAQVLVMTGMRQTVALVSKILLDPGARVCVEDPGYPAVRDALTDAGASPIPVAVDQHGLRVEELENQSQIRLVYVTPSHQYPLGVAMSLARRLALLDWATRTRSWILEDDYDSEYRYGERPLIALQGLDRSGRVLYMGTFSKVLFPALRLSYLIVPKALVEVFARGREAIERSPAVMEQIVLSAFFNEGHFGRHIRRMKQIYEERQATLIEAARHKLAGALSIEPTPTGLHVMGWLPEGVDDRQVWRLAQAHEIDTVPLSAHALLPQPSGGLLLGYASVGPQEIRAGIDKLARALEAAGLGRFA